MILQLKVTLQNCRPLIWRRLQVDGEMTFEELHEILQIAFDWDNSHMHEFAVGRTEGEKVNRMFIKDVFMDDSNAKNGNFDETMEFLDDWLVEKKDWLIYTYDFGENWEHKIELEKILEPVEKQSYPYCVKAVGVAPPEDQRFEWMTGMLQIDNISNDELTEQINDCFRDTNFLFRDDDVIDELLDEEFHAEEFVGESVIYELLTTAKEFNQAKPWFTLDDDQIFMIMNNEYDVEMYCSVLGSNEETFGLVVYLGQEGYQSLVRLFNGEMTEANSFDQRCLFATFSNRNELSKEEYEFIKNAGFTFRGKNQWPTFLSLTPGKLPWSMSGEEMKMMTMAMQQTLDLIKELTENHYEIESFLLSDKIVTREKQEKWTTTVYIIDHEAAEELETAPLLVSELDVKRVEKLKKYPTPIEIGVVVLHIPIEGNAGDRPIIPTFVAGVDSETGMVLFGELLADGSSSAIQQFLVHSLQKLKFCPSVVKLRKENIGILENLLKELKCTIDIQSELPEFEQFLNIMYEDLFE